MTTHGRAEETRMAGERSAVGATVCADRGGDEADLRNAEAAVALEWRPGDVILGLYEVRRVTEGLGEDTEEKDYHEGGFGRVYKVFHRGWNMELAVKTPRREAFDSEAKKANFLRECETWIGLGLHPHVASCFYVRELGGVPRVFSEYADAGTLSDWIRYRNLYEGDEKAVLGRMLDIAIQFAWGLHHAHEQGLVHQDVKPLNLLMMADGTAKVTDFGLARARALPEGENVSGGGGPGTVLVAQAGGMTPAYCSPEQAAGEKLTRRTDVWSWAVSLLEMFQGGASWESGVLAAGALEQFLAHNGEEEGIPPMPDGVAALLRRCFRQGPDERPHDMLEVVRDLATAYQAAAGEPYPRPDPKAAADSPDSLNNRGVSMQDIGRLDEAERLWSEALKRDPAHLASTCNLALLQWRTSRIATDEVVRRLEEVRRGQPTPRAAFLLAMVHAERMDYETAARQLEQVPAEDVETQDARRRLVPLKDVRARCLRTFEGHAGHVNAAALSADGVRALSGSEDRTMRLWEVASGHCLRTFAGHSNTVLSVSLSADGRLALSGCADRSVRLWDVETGRCLRTFAGHEDSVFCVRASTDGRRALSGSWDQTLRLWDLSTGECLRVLKHAAPVVSVCLTADGRFALSGCYERGAHLWDLRTGECVRTLGEGGRVNAVCLSADDRLALLSLRGTPQLFDLATGACLRTFHGHGGEVQAVSLSRDGRFALSGSGEAWRPEKRDLTLRVWEVATGRCLRILEGHAESVTSVCLSPDASLALSGSIDKTLKTWDLGLAHFAHAPAELARAVSAAQAVHADSLFVARVEAARAALRESRLADACGALQEARGMDGRERDSAALQLWSALAQRARRTTLRNAWHLRTLEGHAEVGRVCLSSDGLVALSHGFHEAARLWEVATGRCLRTLGDWWWQDASLSGDGRCILAVIGGALELVDATTGKEVRRLRTSRQRQNCACLSRDARHALSASDDHKAPELRLYDGATGDCLRTFAGHTGEVRALALSAGGGVAVSGSDDQTLRVWTSRSETCVGILAGHANRVRAADIGADGRVAVSGSWDKTVRIWDLATRKCVRVLEGHDASVESVCLSADGRFVASGGGDNTLRLWDVAAGKCLRVLTGHAGAVSSVCLSADMRFALSGSRDGTLRLWELDWDVAVDEPAARGSRSLWSSVKSIFRRKGGTP
jgi:WD40 repeat protein/serine/threonine protein kinase